MPSALTREQWPLGWTPSADNTNGNPEGLLRMDNLRLDNLGALTLVRGFKNINGAPFAGYVHSCYSAQFYNQKHRFVGLSTGQVLHAADGVSFSDEILNSGNTARARFTDVFGTIFVSSGPKKAKYDGISSKKWGLPTPKTAVAATINSQEFYDISGADGVGTYSTWEMVEGANFAGTNGAHVDNDATTLRSVIGVRYSKDFTAFPGGGKGLDTDIFSFRVRLGDSAHVDKIRVEIGLGTISDLSQLDNYYWQEWQHDVDQTEFVEGVDNFTTLQTKRSDFARAGDDATLDWSNVGCIRVTYIFNDTSLDNLVTDFKLSGSTKGPLNGFIDYVSINVRDNGTYIGKSAISPKFAQQINVINANVSLTPETPTDAQVNQIWLYRRGGLLPSFLRIGVIDLVANTYTDSAGNSSTYTGVVTDICPDTSAQDLDIQANESTVSIADVEDEFFSIIPGIYFERLIVSTAGEILLSEELNPEAIDNRFRLRVSGDKTEVILWLGKIANTLVLVGTTKGLYELAGTLRANPDGTIDARIVPLGEKHPPTALEFAVDSGTIIYPAEDGYRLTRGGPSELISPQLDLLFKSETRHDIAPVAIYVGAQAVYPLTVYKGQIIASTILQDGSRPLFVYDFKLQYWRLWECNPICLFTEEDGTLIGGFGNPGDYNLKILDVGNTIDTQGGLGFGQRVFFQTVYDSNGQPRNRKDAYTLKLLIDTGGQDVNIYLSGDDGGWYGVGKVNTSFLQDVYIDIFESFTQVFGLGFRYGIRITSDGYNLTKFQLNRVCLEYDPRPELTTSLRILPSNLGSFCRKRFTNFAFVVDTLGASVTFQPTVDGISVGAALTFANVGKKTIIYYFVSEVIGTDIGGTLNAVAHTATPINATNRGAFEYYGLNQEEIVSEKLPTPVKYLVIPANDYGNPDRKRHSSYKFQINTSGHNVRFTPILDGVSKNSATFNTTEKRTVEYFFTEDTAGIDIGGILETLADAPFEFYGVITPQKIELLPPRLKEFYIPETNYGIAAKKRIRTMPMEINTNGQNVSFTPIVDGVRLTPTIFNTPTRKTVLHYFNTDVFGVDFAGELLGVSAFEFYGLLKPETVEVLPVSKLFDQVGPVHLARMGKIVGFRIRIITGEVNLPWRLISEDETIGTGNIVTVPNTDDVYEVEWISKGRIGVISRMEIGPTTVPFNRYYVEFKINYGGNDSSIKRIRITDAFALAQMGQ